MMLEFRAAAAACDKFLSPFPHDKGTSQARMAVSSLTPDNCEAGIGTAWLKELTTAHSG